MFAISVQPNGNITCGGNTLATGGQYVGNPNWGANVAALKTPPTTVYRYEVCIGGWGDGSFGNIKNIIASQGTGSGSILYRNFLALKNACPGIDAINFDDEQTYDVGSATDFGWMLNGLGYMVSLAPYTQQSYWVQLKNNLGSGCDLVYLQCYSGGAGNDPGQWGAAFGNGFRVMPGIESNNHSSTTFWAWAVNDRSTGGFYWPDVVWGPGSNWGAFEIIDGIGIPNGYPQVCQMANLNSGLFVNANTPAPGDPATGSPIDQWTSYPANQIWSLQYTAANEWTLFFNNSAEAISTITAQQGGYLRLYPWYDGSSQRFSIIPASGWPGCYYIQFTDGLFLDDQFGGMGDGNPFWEWTFNGSDPQIYQFRYNPLTGY